MLTQNNFVREIVSGGQTGVDRAALDIAIEIGIVHGGWCPYERKAEDGVIPAKYNLREAPKPTLEESVYADAIYKKRTELNARDSDGTLIIVKDAPIGGTFYTIEMVEKHKKPYLIFNLVDDHEIKDIANWIIKNSPAPSGHGTLIYRTASGGGAGLKTLQWVDSNGKIEQLRVKPGRYTNPSLSPDGKRVALTVLEGEGPDVWVYDSERDAMTRLGMVLFNAFHNGGFGDRRNTRSQRS